MTHLQAQDALKRRLPDAENSPTPDVLAQQRQERWGSVWPAPELLAG